MIEATETRRLNLDEMDARLKAIERQELADLGIDPDAPRALTTVDEPTAELLRLREENAKMQAMISRAIDARSRAREFMTIWNDPRKLPELIQEVYLSHPNIQAVKVALNDDAAQRAARLIAHMALMYELHPLITGMFYAWEDKGKVCVEMGYRAYVEMVDCRQDLDLDGPHEMTPEQLKLHGVGPDDRGSVCYVWDWAKKRRFEANGVPYKPAVGVGIWRAKGQYDKPDPVAKGRSNQWTSGKNAVKAVGRFALSFALTKIADMPDAMDMVYDSEQDMWTLPVRSADWVNNTDLAGRFAKLLADKGIDQDEFNAYLGHNWRYTQLQPDEIKAKVDEFARTITIAPPAEPAAEPTPETVEPPAKTEGVESTPAVTPEPPAEPPTEPPARDSVVDQAQTDAEFQAARQWVNDGALKALVEDARAFWLVEGERPLAYAHLYRRLSKAWNLSKSFDRFDDLLNAMLNECGVSRDEAWKQVQMYDVADAKTTA